MSNLEPGVGADQAVRTQRERVLLDLTGLATASGREDRALAYLRAWVAARADVTLKADAVGNLVLAFADAPRPASDAPGPGRAGAGRASAGRAGAGAGSASSRRGTARAAAAGTPAPGPASAAASAQAAEASAPPLFFTAHLDHPAFVVERVVGPDTVEVSFRGGVMDAFFERAPILIHAAGDTVLATLTGESGETPAGKVYLAELEGDQGPIDGEDERDSVAGPADAVRVGDVATWLLLPAQIDQRRILHAPACDDLAGAAAALCAFDELRALRARGTTTGDVRLLFTRGEEIGFLGATAACRLGTMPRGSRVVALENSRAFPESPVGGGPIVRVGDRLSTFSPWLTNACAQRAEELFGGPSTPSSAQRAGQAAKRPWQRKLMAGGACEASVFCHYGYEATCLCLPLGNYHNMPYLAELQAGTYDHARLGPPRAAREFIHVDDFHGLVDLLVGLGVRLPDPAQQAVTQRFERLLREKAFVLGGGLPESAESARAAAPEAPTPTPTREAPAAAGRAARPASGKPARRGASTKAGPSAKPAQARKRAKSRRR